MNLIIKKLISYELYISAKDEDSEVEIRLYNRNGDLNIYINRTDAQAIIDHLKREFEI